ncbi:MAG TPA: ABC transporter permease [Thermoplasmata archaeon]|nr:ABC transporter permease [Thermoplasmata archaeon]
MVEAAAAIGPSAAPVPSVEQVFRLARYQLRDYLRSRRYLLMMALVGIIGLILTAVVGYFRPAAFLGTPLDFYTTMWGSGVTVVIIFAGVIFGGDAIAGEFQNKTGYFLMGLPLRRSVIYIGKYIAALVASFSAIVVFLVILLANGLFYFGANALPWQLGPSFLLATIYLLALLGATFLFSSMFKTSTYATLVVAVLFLFGFTLLQDLVEGLAHVTPWFIISYADTTIGAVLSTTCANQPGAHTCSTPGPGGRTFETMVNNPTIPQGVLIMLGYFVVTAILGLVIFEREEFS